MEQGYGKRMFGKTDINVTIVATLRPDILKRTLDSFSWMVRAERHIFSAVINIDRAPEDADCSVDDVLKVVKEYMPVRCVMSPEQPSFARAVRNVWEASDSRYVLHLEDDWEFVREINIDWCVDEMEAGRADYVRFSKRTLSERVMSEKFKPSLLPSLWLGDSVRCLARAMVDNKDPEKQLRRGVESADIDAHLPGKIIDYPGDECVRDIGREWREARQLGKWNKEMKDGEDMSFSGVVTWRKLARTI
jgi:hypothetical protein